MSLTTGPNSGQLVNAALGESHYAELMRQWRAIDGLLQATVISMALTAPPGMPADGDAYFVPTGGTGAFAANGYFRYSTVVAAWDHIAAQIGHEYYDKNTLRRYRWNGTAMVDVTTAFDGLGNALFYVDANGQLHQQFVSGFDPNSGLMAGMTLSPITDELPGANQAPSIMLRSTPLASSAGHYSARWALYDATGGMDFRCRSTALGSQSYFLNLSGDDGLVTSKGGFGWATFDGSGIPTRLATFLHDGTNVVLNNTIAGSFLWKYAGTTKAELDKDGNFYPVGSITIPTGKVITITDAPVAGTDGVNKTYADSLVTGLWDDRGNFDASVNAYPSSGGSGTAGAILKGDIWTVSVAGTLPTGQAVTVGDTVRALQDTPGNTQANWAIGQTDINYTPENVANKDTDGTLAANSDAKYASQKAVKTYADAIAAASLPLHATADKATILATARAINGVNFDGSAAITVGQGYGTYAARPAANTVPAGYLYTASDIGVSGCEFISNGSAWKQSKICRLFAQTANSVNSGTAETSIFNTGVGSLTLPNGCIAAGTVFTQTAYGKRSGNSSTPTFQLLLYIGTTQVAASEIYTSATGWNDGRAKVESIMTCRTTGATGTFTGTGEYVIDVNHYWNGVGIYTSTAATVDTTGGISPDVRTKFGTNAGVTLTIVDAVMDVMGLV